MFLISFFVSFRKVPNGRYVDVRKPKSFLKAGYRTYAETVFIVHGFNGTARDKHMRYLKDGKTVKKANKNFMIFNPLMHDLLSF